MAPEAATQERVYQALKRELLLQRYRAGTRIDLQRIADEQRASTTPVREAMHRLLGERLVEAHDDGGFQIALPRSQQLLDLYAWNAQHLLAAIHVTREVALIQALRQGAALQAPDTSMGKVVMTADLFAAIGRATGNGEFLGHIEAVNDRLHFPRIAEVHYFGDVAREVRTLARVDDSNVQMNTRRRIIAYHRRRIEHVSQIATILHSQALS